MRFSKPEPWAVAFIIAATALLLFLGGWQVERLQWKNALLADMAQAQSAPALVVLPKDPQEAFYRNVVLSGHFIHQHSFYGVAAPRGGRPGYFALTPFQLSDGRVVLVNRGWTPKGEESKPEGRQQVQGVLRPARHRRYFSPENVLEKNIWFFEDLDAMGRELGAALVPVVVEEVRPYKAGEFPIGSDGKISLRNDHLGYAITWFALAFAGLVMFALYYRVKPPAQPKG